MNWLLGQKPAVFIPVLRYIFDHIESCLEKANGAYPTLIVLEEAWAYVAHEIFANKIKDWEKTLRKKNARLVFTAPSLADLYDPSTKTLTQTTAAILESCPTKVYLPNNQMDEEMRSLYKKIGLSERQLEIIETIAEPKKHYYVTTPQGTRLIDLSFTGKNSLPLSFVGLSKKKGQRLMACQKKYGKEWVNQWLKENNLSAWAEAPICDGEKVQ
jgi:type IV secretion system protein VirB4